jgi:hypothetical protein
MKNSHVPEMGIAVSQPFAVQHPAEQSDACDTTQISE